MTFRKSVLAALGAASVACIWIPQTGHAAALPTLVVNIPRVTVPVVRPVIPAVRPVVAVAKPTVPVVTHPVSAPKPLAATTTVATHTPAQPATHAAPASTPSTHAPASTVSTHTATSTSSTHSATDPNSVPWANLGGATTLDPNVPVPAHTGPAIAAELNGKPVIKLTNVSGNETTVYFLSRDQKHILSVISSISTTPPQHVATTQPVTPATGHPGQPPSSGQTITSTPVSYPEIKDALGRPIGYVNAQGQGVYFNNGQIPAGYTVGPNNTIQTYVTTTSAPTPPSHPTPAPAPQPPAASKPPASTTTTFKPTSYPEIKDAYGAPMGYVSPQGPVYFPNGRMPPGYFVGPNNTIETYIKS